MAGRNSMLGLRLTSKIALLVIASVGLSVVAVTATIYQNLANSTRTAAIQQQSTNLNAAATILVGSAGGYLPGIQLSWTDDDQIERLSTLAMPQKFLNHDLVDSIARVTGSDVSIFGRAANADSYERISTTSQIAGERIVGSLLDAAGAAHEVVMQGQAFVGDDLVEGRAFYSAYLPIVDQSGAAVGFLAVGSDKAVVEASVHQTLQLLMCVSAVVLGALGLAGYLISRTMMAPLPKLAKVMGAIAEGDYATEVPFRQQSDEIGEMARAVDVFREIGLKVGEMTDAEHSASVQRRAERADMMAALQVAFGEVVDAAVAGDFSKRVHEGFEDRELNMLARSVNTLVETMDRGIGDTGAFLGALANTDLTRRMEGEYGGVFAKLRNDTNRVTENLSRVVRQLRKTSSGLKIATREILSGANDLSDRTTRQAATIEETSAAIEQLASTVAENAQTAQKANTTAQTVSDGASESVSIMVLANAAMGRITDSSGKISNIIGMIDDIAFQTNLLALNASVEAARAGDAGKGFAVVAVEVRRLAQSAASASADVKGLIDQSAFEVKEGNQLVLRAAEQLSSMLSAVESNAMLMESISEASQSQATAIEEVSHAMRLLDEMTQHNAALVEQTNAAIEQTEGQASDLDEIVAVFTIADSENNETVRSAPDQSRRELRPLGNAA